MCELQGSQCSQQGVQQTYMVQAAFSIMAPSVKKLDSGIKNIFFVSLGCLSSMDYLEITPK